MDDVETSALRTMMEVCENPDVRQGIQCALNFIEVSGYNFCGEKPRCLRRG